MITQTHLSEETRDNVTLVGFAELHGFVVLNFVYCFDATNAMYIFPLPKAIDKSNITDIGVMHDDVFLSILRNDEEQHLFLSSQDFLDHKFFFYEHVFRGSITYHIKNPTYHQFYTGYADTSVGTITLEPSEPHILTNTQKELLKNPPSTNELVAHFLKGYSIQEYQDILDECTNRYHQSMQFDCPEFKA